MIQNRSKPQSTLGKIYRVFHAPKNTYFFVSVFGLSSPLAIDNDIY